MAKEQEEKTLGKSDQSNSLQLDFEVSIFDLFKHYFQVTVRVKTDQLEMNFCLPSWTPGSYMIRDYGTHLHKFEVKNSNTGESVHWEMVDLHRWKLKNTPS